MLCTVRRTSDGDNKQPCPEATRRDRIDTQRIHKQHRANGLFDGWHKGGQNHREDGDYLLRDMVTPVWVVELQDLDALIAFCQKYGKCVVAANEVEDRVTSDTPLAIEIYDGYRE